MKLKHASPYLREFLSHCRCFTIHINSTLILSNQQTTFNVNSLFIQTSTTLFSDELSIGSWNVNSWFSRTLIALFSFPLVLLSGLWLATCAELWWAFPTIAYKSCYFPLCGEIGNPRNLDGIPWSVLWEMLIILQTCVLYLCKQQYKSIWATIDSGFVRKWFNIYCRRNH